MHQKERLLGLACTKRRVLTRKRMESIVKATTKNLYLTRKKKRTSRCHESEWFDCHLTDVENLAYVMDDTRIRRYNKKASCLGSFQCVNENCALLKYCGKQKRLHLNKTNQACSVCVKEGDYNACPAIKMGVSWWLVSRLNTPQWLSYLWSKEALQANRGSEQEIMSRQVYRHKSNWRCDYWYFKRGQTFSPKCISYCRLHPRRRDALLCKAENQQYRHSLEAGPALRSKHLARDPCCIFQLNYEY